MRDWPRRDWGRDGMLNTKAKKNAKEKEKRRESRRSHLRKFNRAAERKAKKEHAGGGEGRGGRSPGAGESLTNGQDYSLKLS